MGRNNGGNAQFTLQPYEFTRHPVEFFKIPNGTKVITIINEWYIDQGLNRLAAFSCYSGDWSLANPPPEQNLIASWWPPKIPGVNTLIPDHTATSCERLHL